MTTWRKLPENLSASRRGRKGYQRSSMPSMQSGPQLREQGRSRDVAPRANKNNKRVISTHEDMHDQTNRKSLKAGDIDKYSRRPLSWNPKNWKGMTKNICKMYVLIELGGIKPRR